MSSTAPFSYAASMTFKQSEATAARATWLLHATLAASGADATGLTLAMTISKAGGAFAAPNAGSAIAELTNGWYKVTHNAADLDTLGALAVRVTGTGIDIVNVVHQVVAYDQYDAVRHGLTALPNAALGATGGLSAPVVRGGTAQAGAASTITLDAGASATNDLYDGLLCKITGGTGAGQTRQVISYVGSTKVATVDRAWATNPDNTSVFELLPDNPVGVDPVTLKSGSLVAADIAGDALAAMSGKLESKPAVSVGTVTQAAPTVARSMRQSYDTVVTLGGTFGGATVQVQTTEDETAASPVWTDRSSGGLTSAGSVTVTGPHSAWRATATSGASGTTAVTVKAADRIPQTVR